MKRTCILIALAGLFIFPAFAQHPPQDKNWEAIFQDEFNYQYDADDAPLWYKCYGVRNAGTTKEAF